MRSKEKERREKRGAALHAGVFSLLLLLFALSPAALALTTDKDQPADIQARSVDADERTNIAIYQDNVRYVQARGTSSPITSRSR